MNYKRESGDRSFAVPRTWSEGSWARSENKHRCAQLFINAAAVFLCVVGLYSIIQSGMNLETFFSWTKAKGQIALKHQSADKTKSAAPASFLSGLGKQVTCQKSNCGFPPQRFLASELSTLILL
jgi:hypothetical protein